MQCPGSWEQFTGLALAGPGPNLPICIAGIRLPALQPRHDPRPRVGLPELEGME